jgi:predicted dehydrogenase
MPTSPCSVGVIGLNVGSHHIEGYRRQGIRVAAICDVNPARLAECVQRFRIERAYASAAELIADPEVDIVDVAIQPQHRWPVVAKASRAGKPIFIQKPLAMSLRQAVAMVELCERRNVPLMVNHNSCFVPGFLAVEPYLRTEYLGDIYAVSVQNWGLYLTFPERHIIPAMMIHHLALLHKWFGRFETVYCQAHGHTRTIEEGEVAATAQFRHASDVCSLVVDNWALLERVRRGPGHPREELRIQGTKGSICGHSEEMVVFTTEPRPAEIRPAFEGTWFPDGFGLGMRHFQECLAAGTTPITDGRGNLHVLQAVFAAYESARTNRVVAIDEIALDGDWDLSPEPVLEPDPEDLA